MQCCGFSKHLQIVVCFKNVRKNEYRSAVIFWNRMFDLNHLSKLQSSVCNTWAPVFELKQSDISHITFAFYLLVNSPPPIYASATPTFHHLLSYEKIGMIIWVFPWSFCRRVPLINSCKQASSSLAYCSAPDASKLVVMQPLASESNSAQYVRTNAGWCRHMCFKVCQYYSSILQ